MKFGLRLSRSLGTVGAALLFARVSSAQAHACKPASSEPAAAWPAPLDRPVTIRATGLTLRDALDRVAAIAKIRLSYSSEALPLSRAVCLAAEGDPAGKILAELTAGTAVTVNAVLPGPTRSEGENFRTDARTSSRATGTVAAFVQVHGRCDAGLS